MSSPRRQDIAVLATLWFAMAACVGIVGDFPLNDDWIYGGATRSILVDGTFRIPGPTIANVFAQAWYGALFCLPFGFSYTALRISTLVLGFAGLSALYALITENGGCHRTALVAAISLAVYPLFFGLAGSFMTDVPFIATALIAMFLLMRFIRTGSGAALLLGTLACLATVLIRQVGLAVPLALAILAIPRFWRRPSIIAASLLPILVSAAGHILYQHWLIATGRGPEVYFSTIAQLLPADPAAFLINATRYTLFSLPYAGLAILPLALWTRHPSPHGPSNTGRVVATLVGLILFAGLWWKGDRLPILGNTLMEWGQGPLTQRDTYLLQQNLPSPTQAAAALWTIATALGVAGGIAATARLLAQVHLIRHHPLTPAQWLGAFAMLTGGIYWAMMLLLLDRYGYFFDRYTLPIAAFAIVLIGLGGTASVTRRITAACLLITTGLLSVTISHDYLAWNRARWAALNSLTTDKAIPPTQIDGGYEFNGLTLYDPRYSKTPGKSYWWVADDTYVLASGPLAGYHEIARQAVSAWLPGSVGAVVTLRRD